MDEQVNIKLSSTADTSGFDKLGAASKGAADGLGASAKSSKELAGALGKNAEVGSQAVSMFSQLGNVSKGGAEGLAAAARSGIAFGQMLKGVLAGAGPVGIAITALTLLGAAAVGLVKAFKPAGESVDQFKSRLAELDKANLKSLDATLSALSDRLKNAKDEADAVRASLDKIDDAEMAAQLATVKKSDLTPNQKEEQELIIRDEFKRRREGRQRDALTEAASGARETRDALAPEFEDARQKYGDLLNEKDAIVSRDREIARLRRDAGLLAKQGYINDAKELNAKADALKASQPRGDDLAKFDAELASARDRFQGADGKGGIAAQYQSAVKDAEKADRALARFNDTLKRVGEWDRARARIDNGGIDPRDTEAAARRSPGRARMVGPDGRVVEYDVAAAPTTAQQIAAQADAARRGPISIQQGAGVVPAGATLPRTSDPRIQRAGGDSKTADALKGTTKATESAPTGEDTAKAAEALKAATEQQVSAQQAASEQTIGALTDMLGMSETIVGTLTPIPGQITSMRAEIQKLWGAVRAAQRKSNSS